MNEFFPNWEVANIVLNHIVEYEFKLQVSEEKNDPNTLFITFIPEDVITNFIPREYQDIFKFIHDKFMNHIVDILNFKKIFKKYKYEIMNEITYDKIKNELEKNIKQFETDNNTTLKDIFLHNFLRVGKPFVGKAIFIGSGVFILGEDFI